jgi:hypothetical protein
MDDAPPSVARAVNENVRKCRLYWVLVTFWDCVVVLIVTNKILEFSAVASLDILSNGCIV